MGGLFKTPKTPQVKEIPVPTRSSAEVEGDANEQRKDIARRSAASGWLTGGLGVPRSQENYAATSLLGGG